MPSRESLHKALSGDGSPDFDAVLKVLGALGLQLRAVAAQDSMAQPGASADLRGSSGC
jgi:DNA-binding phage protein